MKSTKDYPDEVINFMRNHPTMYNAVYPVHKRPLVVRTNVDYEFTTVTVDQVAAADGSYEVLFLGTGETTGYPSLKHTRTNLLSLNEATIKKYTNPVHFSKNSRLYYPLSQLRCSPMHKAIQVQIASFRKCSHQTSDSRFV